MLGRVMPSVCLVSITIHFGINVKIYIVSDYFRYEGHYNEQYFNDRILAEGELERRIQTNELNGCEPTLREISTEND